jgi:peptidoglycan/LPS O-acetylase OafA/YrhL
LNKVKWLSAIRILGLSLVLCYHLFYEKMTGGFLGVDIFFTFSGYLITAVILAEVRKKGAFRLLSFYRRRFTRIFVPLFLSIAFTLPLALLISPDFLVGAGKQTAAALGFVTNYYEIAQGGSYEAQLLPHLFLHTWSLSVEMQFYALWGAGCAGLALLGKTLFPESARKRLACVKALFFASSVGLAAASFLFMRYACGVSDNLSAVYFNTLSRLYPFFIGAALAAVWGIEPKGNIETLHPGRLSPKLAAAILALAMGFAGFAIFLLARTLKFEDEAVWQYGFLCASLLTAVLIFCARALHSLTPASVEEPRFVSALADLSYNIYLFHWPLYIVFSGLIQNGTLASLATIAASIFMSAIAFYVIQPVLERQKSVFKGKNGQIASSAAVIAVLACSVAASGFAIQKAPAITSIEASFNANQVSQDVLDIFYLLNGIVMINDKPLAYASTAAPLKANLLPKPETPSEGSANPSKPIAVPKPDPISKGGVTIIGDSVALGVQSVLKNTIMECSVDAKVSRSISAGYDIMMDMQRKGTLREYVVIALGTNSTSSYAKLLSKFIDSLEEDHRLIFVTPFDGRSGDSGNAGKAAIWERKLPGQYPFVTIADWNALIRDQTSLLAGDKVHMGGQASMNLYAKCVADAVVAASQKPPK